MLYPVHVLQEQLGQRDGDATVNIQDQRGHRNLGSKRTHPPALSHYKRRPTAGSTNRLIEFPPRLHPPEKVLLILPTRLGNIPWSLLRPFIWLLSSLESDVMNEIEKCCTVRRRRCVSSSQLAQPPPPPGGCRTRPFSYRNRKKHARTAGTGCDDQECHRNSH